MISKIVALTGKAAFVVICVAAALAIGGMIAVSLSPSAFGDPLPPPGWILTEMPDFDHSGFPDGEAFSWCEGTTRVHVVRSISDGVDQDLESNARTCGGTS